MLSLKHFSCFLTLMLLVPAFGQEGEKEPYVSVEFKMLGWSDDGIEDIRYKEGSSLKELEIPSWERSDAYTYRGPATMKFFYKDNKDAEPIATATLSPDVPQYTILMLRQGGQYRALALPDDTKHSPVGKARVINFSNTKIVLRANNKDVVVLEPRASKIMGPNTGSKLLKVEMAYEDGGQWRQTGIQRVVITPTQQTTLFYVTDTSDFFKSGEGNVKAGPQPFVLRQEATSVADTDDFFKTGTGDRREGPQKYILTQDPKSK